MKEFTKEVVDTLREIKPALLKKARWLDGEPMIAVKVYACHDEEVGTYDVEVQLRENDEYIECWVTETFSSESDESLAEKEAVKRAKQVLRSAKGWVEYTEIKVKESVEVYT